MVFCSKCGKENDVDAKFCRECGSSLTNHLETSKDKENKPEFYVYALVTIIGIILILTDALEIVFNYLLVPVGLILTVGGLVRLFPRIFKLKAILIGFVAFILAYFILYILSFMYIGVLSPAGYFTQFIISILISGALAGYFSGKNYLNGSILGLMIGMVFSIGFTNNLSAFIGGFVVLTIFGLTGGLLGVLIYRKNHSYKVLD